MFIHIEDGGELRGGIESGGKMVLVCRKCGFSWVVDGRGEPSVLITGRTSHDAALFAERQHPEWFRGKK